MAKILINSDELSKYSIIGGDVDSDKVLPSIKVAQEIKIRKILGITLYNKLCDDYYNDTLNGKYLELYDDYIKPILIHSATAIYLRSGAYNISNGGITKSSPEGTSSVDKNEVDFLVDGANNLAKAYQDDFEDWIKINYSFIPEYEYTCKRNKMLIGGWVLNKKRY